MVDQNNGWTWGVDDKDTNNGSWANGGGDDAGKKNPDDKGAGGDAGGDGKDKKPWEVIPKFRFDEVNDKYKKAEEELTKYKEAEAKEVEKKKKEQGKYEEVISEKEKEIATLKWTVAQVEFLTSTVETMVNTQLAEMQKAVGDDKMKKILSLVKYDSLDVKGKIESLIQIKELVAEVSPPKKEEGKNSGWSWIGWSQPAGWSGGWGKASFWSMLTEIVKSATGK